jgi:tetratricopeptide (TPR) repeat protein
VRVSHVRTVLIVAGLIGLAAAGALAAVRPYDPTKIYPTESAFMGSIKAYQDALAANPKDADAAYWLGYAYWEASVLYRHFRVPYGADYLDKSIAMLEQAVRIDDKHMAAWQLLAVAYFTRGAAPSIADEPTPSDDEKSKAAAERLIELSRDPSAANRGVPRAGARSGEVAIKYVPLPDRSVRFNPANWFVVGDPDTKLLYRFPCPSLPGIRRPALFLTKWEAFDRGYTPAAVCPPP